jgi:hypothetical protein
MDASRKTATQRRASMKRVTLEQEITASRPHDFEVNKAFVDQTMKQVLHISSHTLNQKHDETKLSLLKRFTLLPIPLMIAIVMLGLCITSGVAYAAFKYVPSLLDITSKTTSQRGTTEYSVANFEQCQTDGLQKINRFELKKNASIQTDNEIVKILQAKCELGIIDKFVKDRWPTKHVGIGDGEKNTTYARPEYIAQYVDESNNQLTYIFDNKTIQKSAPADIQLRAYEQGREVAFKDIPKHSTVFIIMQVQEQSSGPSGDVVGALGIVKLSLPIEYYYEKQNLLTEINQCIGNDTELCPSTASIDVFPREANSEGAGNPYFSNQDGVYREITGKIQGFNVDSMTLQTTLGSEYVVITPKGVLERYNLEFAKNYTDVDATLKVGSVVSIRYTQPANADPKLIQPEHIQAISLLLDVLDTKGNDAKQY